MEAEPSALHSWLKARNEKKRKIGRIFFLKSDERGITAGLTQPDPPTPLKRGLPEFLPFQGGLGGIKVSGFKCVSPEHYNRED